MNKVTKCSKCGSEIVFLLTKNRKRMPVDVSSITDPTAEEYDHETMTSHFATCPQAKHFRRRRGQQR